MESLEQVTNASRAVRWPRTAERRGEARFSTRYPAKLRFADTDEPLECLVVDVSMSGARIRLFAPLAIDAIVEISFEKSMIIGAVRNCTDLDNCFEIGVAVSVFYDRENNAGSHESERIRSIIRPISRNPDVHPTPSVAGMQGKAALA